MISKKAYQTGPAILQKSDFHDDDDDDDDDDDEKLIIFK